MNNIDNERLNELVIDEWIWVLFIILSALNINGDELEKKYCIYHENKIKERSKNIFTITVFSSFLIYLYLAYKNCCKYKKIRSMNKNTNLIKRRCFGSILVVIASFLFLTAQLEDLSPTNPSIQ